MKKGDLVAHKENGLVGIVVKEYKPTGAECQILIKTLDKREYHAPMEEWVKLKISVSAIKDINQMLLQEKGYGSNNLNPFGEYVVNYAKNHGSSIDEVFDKQMVKARYDYFNMTGR